MIRASADGTKEQRKVPQPPVSQEQVNLTMPFFLGVRCVSSPLRSLNLCLPLDERDLPSAAVHPAVHPAIQPFQPSFSPPHERQRRWSSRRLFHRPQLSRRRLRPRPSCSP